MSELFDAALDALEAGLSVVPPQEDGTKAPALAWKAFQDRLPTEAELQHWYANGVRRHGLGLVCGRVSGHLETFEFEGRAVEAGIWEQFKASVAEAGLLPLLLRIQHGYGERTPSGGIHLLYHCTEGIDGNLKLARRPGPDGKPEVLIETRGEGGYVVVAPSSGPVHPSGRPWELLAGGFATIATITVEERAALFAIARSFDQLPAPEWAPSGPDKESAGGRPGDDFNARADWAADVLQPAGWTRTGSRGGREHWYRGQGGRPGWTSATITEDGRYLYVFSSSTELPTEVGLSKFRTYAFLHHGGDFAAASKELRGRGYGDAGGEIRRGLTVINGGATEPDKDPEEPEPGASWLPVDIAAVLAGDLSPLEPTLLARTDGVRLLYPGRVNMFVGEPETCKSWAAQIAAAEEIRRGGRVLYVDFEAEARDVIGHLVALGVDVSLLRNQLLYVRPEESFASQARVGLLSLLAEKAVNFTVLDGVSSAMVEGGLEPNSNHDFLVWFKDLIRPIRKAVEGPIVLVDHVAKDREHRGDWAVGGGQKKARIDGGMFGFSVVEPFGRGLTGVVSVDLFKDRPGSLRGKVGNGKEIARLHLASNADTGSVVAEVHPPVAGAPDATGKPRWRPTGLMEKVSAFLGDAKEDLSAAAIERGIGGKASYVRRAVEALVEEDYVETVQGPRNATLHHLKRPFRESPEIRHSDDLVPPRPSLGDGLEETVFEYESQRPGLDLVPPRPDLVPFGGPERRTTSSPNRAPSPLRGRAQRDEVVAEGGDEVAELEISAPRPDSSCPTCGSYEWEALEAGRRRCLGCGASRGATAS